MSHEVDSFLNHKGTAFDGAGRLGKWKDDGSIDVWLHTQRVPQPLWKHQFFKIEARENKETKRINKEVWSFDFVCHEAEAVLKRQYRYEDDDITRESPPEACPLCKALMWVRTMVKKKKLDWKEPIFRFEGSDKDKAVVIHAGGWWNAYKDVERGSADAEELNDAGIYLKDSWKENGFAKLSYVFTCVDHAHVDEGIKVAVETGLLGDKVKAVIRKAMEELGDEEGNPFVNPFAIRWKFDDKARKFDEKYDAVKLGKLKITDKIEELITGKAPSISHITGKGDAKKLRALMEKHALIEMPFDKFFANVSSDDDKDESTSFDTEELEGKKTKASTKRSSERSEEDEEDKPKRRAKPRDDEDEEDEDDKPRRKGADHDDEPPKRAKAKADEDEAPARRKKVEDDDEEEEAPRRKKAADKEPEVKKIKCDDCPNMMLPTDTKCSKCGAVYEVDEPAKPAVAASLKKKIDDDEDEPPAKKSKGKKSKDAGDDDDDPF